MWSQSRWRHELSYSGAHTPLPGPSSWDAPSPSAVVFTALTPRAKEPLATTPGLHDFAGQRRTKARPPVRAALRTTAEDFLPRAAVVEFRNRNPITKSYILDSLGFIFYLYSIHVNYF